MNDRQPTATLMLACINTWHAESGLFSKYTQKIQYTQTMGKAGWFQQVVAPLFQPSDSNMNSPGTTWSSTQAERAFARSQLNSDPAGKRLRVGFRNNSKLPLLLSWVAENGKCHHFYTLQPAQVIEGPVTALDHIENTNLGHSFCIAYCGDDAEKVKEDKSLDPKYVVGGYKPITIGCDENEDSKTYAHLVTISQEPTKTWLCCSKNSKNLRGSSSSSNEIGNEFDDLCWVVRSQESSVDDKQIKTNHKNYEKTTLGGWPVFLEENWHNGNKELEKRFAEDLACAAKCLPKHASDFLKKNTPVYVNKCFQWGPEVCPIKGRGLCFHPESKWLEENFMHVEKCECVELYDSTEYLKDCLNHWGQAGVLIHEFSHAYHHKCLENGYNNKEIKECYDLAMKDRLYDWVRVKGSQGENICAQRESYGNVMLIPFLFSLPRDLRSGPMAKAYACTNCMEYFAELSAAFLGQPNMLSDEMFNKWYPFNRRQIKEHDPRAYEMLKKMWKVED